MVALLAYVPMLATKPGVVSDDTKTYLYLDPGKWLRTSASIWDPFVALGSVTHETIGYLFPMGPFYWFFSAGHIPTWIAQRLWLGSLLFAAAAGVPLPVRHHRADRGRPPGGRRGLRVHPLRPAVQRDGSRSS